jgi:ADP-heptose:LPS heptosyltransferase
MNDATGHLNYFPAGPSRVDDHEPFDYRLIFNTYLEHGWSYDRICQEMDINPADIDFNFWSEYEEAPTDLVALDRLKTLLGQGYIIFHLGAKLDNSEVGLNRGPIWTPQDWVDLGRHLNKAYGCRIALIGAAYDLEFAKEVMSKTSDDFYVNTIGQLDITETLALIQRARFIVSFPSGVGIVGPYMGVPTTIFWRPQDMPYHPLHERSGFAPEFSENWVPPAVMEAKRYFASWYGTDTPETIADKIATYGW